MAPGRSKSPRLYRTRPGPPDRRQPRRRALGGPGPCRLHRRRGAECRTGGKSRAPARARGQRRAKGAPPEPPGAYLHAITVEGFRGIGARDHAEPHARPRAHARRRAQRLRQVQLRRSPGGAAHRRQQTLGRPLRRLEGRLALPPSPEPVRGAGGVRRGSLGTVTVERRWDDGARAGGQHGVVPAKGRRATALRRSSAGTSPSAPIGRCCPTPSWARCSTSRPKSTTRWSRCWASASSMPSRRRCRPSARRARRWLTSPRRLKSILPRLQALAASSGDQRARGGVQRR